MTWLRRLLGGRKAEAAPHVPEAAPRAGAVAMSADPDNPILKLLTEIGLPWSTPRGELTRRYGVKRHPAYGWDVLPLPTEPPLVEGLLEPLSVQAARDLSPRMPATGLSGQAWFLDDARENLRRTAAQLAERLGPAEIADLYNTVRCAWSSGAASLSLTVWPPELQGGLGGSNPSHEIEPRLVHACHIFIETGLRPVLSEVEQGWIDGFIRIAPIAGGADKDALRTTAAPESQLSFVREPPARIDHVIGAVGRSPGGEALIFGGRQLYVAPTRRIVRFTVDRLTPAKGGGGSYLTVECREPGAGETRIPVTSGEGPDDMTALAQLLGRTFDRPVTLNPYYPDC